jgi:hypothetical protein
VFRIGHLGAGKELTLMGALSPGHLKVVKNGKGRRLAAICADRSGFIPNGNKN